jgi:hypothetical protein
MGRPSQERGFAMAAVAVVVAVVVFLALGSPRRRSSQQPAPRAHPTAVATAAAPSHTPPQPATHPAARVAKEFIRAFLRYETGDLSPDVRRAISTDAMPSVARRLLGQPPRPPAGGQHPSPGRLEELKPGGTAQPGEVSFRATIEYGGVTGAVLMTFRRAGGRWRLVDLR